MKWIGRLFILCVLCGLGGGSYTVIRYPDRTYQKAERLIAEYRSGISGTVNVESKTPWMDGPTGLAYRRLKIKRGREFPGLDLLAVRIDPKEYDFRVVAVPQNEIPSSYISSVAAQEGAHFAINGSYFNSDLGILGLAISDGNVVSKMTTVGENRGIFYVDAKGRPGLNHRDNFSTKNVSQALQSGPWLVRGGKRKTTYKNPDHVRRRSAMCVDDDGLLVFIITDTFINGITLPDLAGLMEEEGAGELFCREALNLDGGTSSQMMLWTGQNTILVRGFINVPVYIVAVPKSEEK